MKEKAIYQKLLKYSWVIAFILVSVIFYEQGMKRREIQFQLLHKQLVELEYEKEKALTKQQNLKLQINSQSDPAWIELALMKGLGVSPEDQQKFFFSQK